MHQTVGLEKKESVNEPALVRRLTRGLGLMSHPKDGWFREWREEAKHFRKGIDKRQCLKCIC